MFSQKCKYAIRAVLFIALQNKKQSYVGGAQVADYLKTPHAFTVKILQELAKLGLISSTKGPGGGFYLSKENLNQNLIHIIEAVDGLDFFNNCGLGLSECSETNPCPIHNTFKDFRNELYNLFKNTTIEKLSLDLIEKKYKLTV